MRIKTTLASMSEASPLIAVFRNKLGDGNGKRQKELHHPEQLFDEVVIFSGNGLQRFSEKGGICRHGFSPQSDDACGNKYSDKDAAIRSSDSFGPKLKT